MPPATDGLTIIRPGGHILALTDRFTPYLPRAGMRMRMHRLCITCACVVHGRISAYMTFHVC
jgi:hypothetical protein